VDVSAFGIRIGCGIGLGLEQQIERRQAHHQNSEAFVVVDGVVEKRERPTYRLRIAILGRSGHRQRHSLDVRRDGVQVDRWHSERHIDRFNSRDCDHFHLVRGDQAADLHRQVAGKAHFAVWRQISQFDPNPVRSLHGRRGPELLIESLRAPM